jgi:hypothetical protein
MSLLAHEVGHAIERDCDLGAALDLAADRMRLDQEAHRPAWKSWRKEVFADLYGALMAGPAFVWSLADYLAKDEPSISAERRPQGNGSWTAYPTTSLRIHLLCRFLELHKFNDDAALIRNQWKKDYPAHELQDYESESDVVISALSAAGRFGELSALAFPLPVPPAMASPERMIAALYRQGIEPRDDQPQPARSYVAAARLLMNEPPREPLANVWEKLARHHLRSQTPFVAGQKQRDEDLLADERELKAGADIADILFRGL